MPISWLCQRPRIRLPRLWIQPSARHRTLGCRLWFSIQPDRQASRFILSEGTPGRTAFYCCDCSVNQASLDLPRGEALDSFMSPSPSSLPVFLTCCKQPSLRLWVLSDLRAGAGVWEAKGHCCLSWKENPVRWPCQGETCNELHLAYDFYDLEFLAHLSFRKSLKPTREYWPAPALIGMLSGSGRCHFRRKWFCFVLFCFVRMFKFTVYLMLSVRFKFFLMWF